MSWNLMPSQALYYMLTSCTIYTETFIHWGFDLLHGFGILSKRMWWDRGMKSQQREWEVGDRMMEWVVDGLEWLNYSYLILVCRGKLSWVLHDEGKYQNVNNINKFNDYYQNWSKWNLINLWHTYDMWLYYGYADTYIPLFLTYLSLHYSSAIFSPTICLDYIYFRNHSP